MKPPTENVSRKPSPIIGSVPNVPPPPPPPPMLTSGDAEDLNIPPPPPPPMIAPPSPRSDSCGGMNSELLRSIRSGTTLKVIVQIKLK